MKRFYRGKLSGICRICGDKISNIPIWMRYYGGRSKEKRYATCRICYVNMWVKR